MRRLTYLLAPVLLLAVSADTFNQSVDSAASRNEGKPPAPAFNLKSIDGKKFELSSLRGKVVVLNFWFTGCAPCVAEFGELNGLVSEFKKKGVVFIAPTLDNETVLKSFLREHRFKYHVVPNAGGLIVGTYSDGTESVVFPTHIVIDKEGKIDARLTGAKGIEDLRKAIARLADARAGKTK